MCRKTEATSRPEIVDMRSEPEPTNQGLNAPLTSMHCGIVVKAKVKRFRRERGSHHKQALAMLEGRRRRHGYYAGAHRATDPRQQRAIEAVIDANACGRLFTRHPANGCVLAREG